MQPGIQSHIEERIPLVRLQQAYALGYRLARIAAMECSVETMLQMVGDAKTAGLTPIVTIADPERIRLFQQGDFIECRNEDDGDISPKAYRAILDDMAKLSLEVGTRLCGGVGSNTDNDTLRWGNEVRGSGWPKGMYGVSWHSYGPYPHEGFAPRSGKHPAWGECEWLIAMAAGLPILISEFGEANTTPTTEQHQADTIRDLWQLWQDMGFWGACQFQIHDGKDPTNPEHRFGIYRCDSNGVIGDLKPVAFMVPASAAPIFQEESSMSAVSETPLFVFNHACVIHNDDGTKSIRWNLAAKKSDAASDEVFSLQDTGDIQTRKITLPDGSSGIKEWEKGKIEGDRLVFRANNARAVFAWQA